MTEFEEKTERFARILYDNYEVYTWGEDHEPWEHVPESNKIAWRAAVGAMLTALEGEKVTEGTMRKVREALTTTPLSGAPGSVLAEYEADDLINAMQNRGILFRERP